MLIRPLARPLLAAPFVVAGAQTVRTPQPQGPVVDVVRAAGIGDPVLAARLVGGIELVGGLALATGRLPRAGAAALAATVVPGLLATARGRAAGAPQPPVASAVADAGATTDPALRTRALLADLGLLGGLLLAAVDTAGRESVRRRVLRSARRAVDALPDLPDLPEAVTHPSALLPTRTG